jgi:hypothetical protein
MDYKNKYLKYKTKYFELKKLISMNGGGRMSKEDKKKLDIKNLKKYFVQLVTKIQKFELIVNPFLECINKEGSFDKIQMNDKMKKLFAKKIKSNYKDMLFNIFEFNFDKIDYDEKTNKLQLIVIPKPNDFNTITRFMWNYKDEYNIEDIISYYADYFYDIISSGPDTWMQGDILYFIGEIDNKEYLFNIKYEHLYGHLKENEDYINQSMNDDKNLRPSPSESATIFKVGTIKKGNDGNNWIVKQDKNKVKQWKKL